jgi:hypothetical protein
MQQKKFLPPRGKVSAIALGQTFNGGQWWEMHVSQDSNTYNINILWATPLKVVHYGSVP